MTGGNLETSYYLSMKDKHCTHSQMLKMNLVFKSMVGSST